MPVYYSNYRVTLNRIEFSNVTPRKQAVPKKLILRLTILDLLSKEPRCLPVWPLLTFRQSRVPYQLLNKYLEWKKKPRDNYSIRSKVFKRRIKRHNWRGKLTTYKIGIKVLLLVQLSLEKNTILSLIFYRFTKNRTK